MASTYSIDIRNDDIFELVANKAFHRLALRGGANGASDVESAFEKILDDVHSDVAVGTYREDTVGNTYAGQNATAYQSLIP